MFELMLRYMTGSARRLLVYVAVILWGVFPNISGAETLQGKTIETAWTQIESVVGPNLSALDRLPGQLEKQAGEHAAVAQGCLALAALEERKKEGKYKVALSRLASLLVEQKDLNGDGRLGWGVPSTRAKHKSCPEQGMLDAFGDGTCNDVNTEYMFQTALATMCLARAYLVTGEKQFIQTAQQAIDDSWDIGTQPGNCKDCFYYWYSYHRNDRGRYVRNTNALMGAAVAWVWSATGKPRYRERALQIVNAENREMKVRNNGYFGIDDPKSLDNPKHEYSRIENHVPWISKSLLDIGRLLKHDGTMKLALAVQDQWQYCPDDAWTCKSSCQVYAVDPQRCRESATASPCFFKDIDVKYAKLCEAVIPTVFQKSLTSYMWWAVLEK